MSEEILELKSKNEKITIELKEAKDNIINLEKINKQLQEIQTQQKKLIDDLNTKSKKDLNNYNILNKELERYKLSNNEIILLKNENMALKDQLLKCNNNLVKLSNENVDIIRQKDKIITNLTNNKNELNKQIDLLNNELSKYGNNLGQSTVLAEEISSLRKNNDNNEQKIVQLQNENRQLKNRMAEIKTNYVSHDEDFKNIKLILNELNNKTELNLKKIQENEKKFDMVSGGKNVLNENNATYSKNKCEDSKNKPTDNVIKEIENNIIEYKLLLDGIKNNNNSFNQINISPIEGNKF